MRKVVIDQGIRPAIPPQCLKQEQLARIIRIIQECWRHNPSSRLTALRMKKDIEKDLTLIKDQVKSQHQACAIEMDQYDSIDESIDFVNESIDQLQLLMKKLTPQDYELMKLERAQDGVMTV